MAKLNLPGIIKRMRGANKVQILWKIENEERKDDFSATRGYDKFENLYKQGSAQPIVPSGSCSLV